MGLLSWFTRNRADTRGPSHPDLKPLELAGTPADAIRRVKATVGRLRRWAVVSETADSLHLTRGTRLFRFTDDITLTFHPTESGTRIHAESGSRIGAGDLGQNRRNILELFAAIRKDT